MNVTFSEGIYIRILPFFLLGYAVAGKPFAYLGIPPLYMGEVLLLMGIWQILQSTHLWKVYLQPSAWLLFFFMLWSAARTIPYLSQYGIFALRDAALWGYGFFAFVIAMILISRPSLLLILMLRYQSFARFFPFVALIGLVTLFFFKRVFFDISSFFQMKPGDILVQLAGIISFSTCGLLAPTLPWIFAVIGSVLVAGSVGRGGLLAFTLAVGAVFLLRLQHARTWKMLLVLSTTLIMIALLFMVFPKNELQDHYSRKISPDQIVKNMLSITSDSEQWGLEGTKRYRLEWWDKIINYTFYGDYFVGGKGYGINLAESDDQLLNGDTSLRNPHNAHLTILARSGVPGLVLWAVLNIAWFWRTLRSIIEAKVAQLRVWEGWFCTLLAFYLAALINATFDVYLEGPMGGIWFWTVFGIGLASHHLFLTLPDLLVTHEDSNRA